MRYKTATGYPYSIPEVDQMKIGLQLPQANAKEFLLIETLLRSPEIMELFKRNREEFQSYWRNHGMISDAPLAGSHHPLLFRDKELDEKLLTMGYIDVGLGIHDLGIVAKLPPQTKLHHGKLVLYGPFYGGANECKVRLQGENPRFLHLSLDVSHPPEAIIQRLRPLLHSRFKAINGRSTHNKAVSKSFIVTRLKYFKCYDFQIQGRSIEEIASIVFHGLDNAVGSTDRALQSVTRMIKSVKEKGRLPPKLY